MINLFLGQPDDAVMTSRRLQKMHELRYQVFHQKLQWKVSSINQQEVDDYDHLSPHYMIAFDGEQASGCWRLLPSEGPYMLRYTFDNLLKGEDAPVSSNVWELSRFAVTSPARRYKGQIFLSDTTFEMFDRLITFADTRGITDYVTVVSTSVERLMVRNGIDLRRFGDQTTTMLDDIESVACWIPLNEKTRTTVSQAVDNIRREQFAIAQ